MKLNILTALMLTGFAVKLFAVPAAPFLITFAQPDGSTFQAHLKGCLLYTSPSPRDGLLSRMPSSA